MSVVTSDLRATAPAAGSSRPVYAGFTAAAARTPSRPALELGGVTLSYAKLHDRAARVAATLQCHAAPEPALTAVFAYRTVSAYAGVLGALLRGHGYVPLSRTFPEERTRLMLEHAGCRAVVCDLESAGQLPEVLAGLERELVILVPEATAEEIAELRGALGVGRRLLGADDLEPAAAWREPVADPDAAAYVLYTSGSTGRPKGVEVTHANVNHYVDTLVEHLQVTDRDRFGHFNELTFDMSVLDLFVAWECGACVCCPTRKELLSPARFLRQRALSVWHSVPSTALMMERLRALRPGSYPTLRRSLFAGEPLPVAAARAWQAAAPHSTVENLYGPTELTVECLGYRWDPTRVNECEHDAVPAGYELGAMRALIVDELLQEVAPGEVGELLVRGPQVARGYLHDPERTAAAFVVPPGREEVHYRTGDRVRRPRGPEHPIVYLGRVDHQVQVLGERVELGEVEAAVRACSGVPEVAAIGWPLTSTGAGGVEVFVVDPALDAVALLATLRRRLPGHMAPRRVHAIDTLPLNANGKIDRAALAARLDGALT